MASLLQRRFERGEGQIRGEIEKEGYWRFWACRGAREEN
jgi:hypothetical protein